MERIKSHISKFKKWQKEPYPVPQMSEEEHQCSACSTQYVGNYCPRCGQSSKIDQRMSLWKTILLFIDVWGLGNRGMFRTIRDLILRPGYLICDYLQGKRSFYFPPFKLLFLLTTLSLVVDAGFNIFQTNYTRDYHISILELPENLKSLPGELFFAFWNYVIDLQERFPALFRLAVMTMTCGFYFIFFRKSKILGAISYPEFFIAMVYMVNMANIYSIIFRFFGSPEWMVALPTLFYIVPLSQISGFSSLNTVLRFVASWILIILFFSFLFLISLVVLFGIYSS